MSLALHPTTPWLLRLFFRLPYPAVAVALGIALAEYLLFLGVTVGFGDELGHLPAIRARMWMPEAVWALLIGFAPATNAVSIRGALRDLDDLAPALALSPEERASYQRRITSYSRPLLTGVGLVGIPFTTWIVLNEPRIWESGERPPLSDPAVCWMVLRNVVAWWLMGRAVVLELLLARAFSTLGERIGEVDLLDRAPLAPFGRRGLRGVLVWMLYMALVASLYAGGWAAPALAVGVFLVLGLALAAFLVPVRGAHQRIRAAKRAELARIHAALRECRDQVLDPLEAKDLTGGRLADLVAYEARMASASEWPFDATTLLRFLLYTGIGLGSWVGAALVERGLEAALR